MNEPLSPEQRLYEAVRTWGGARSEVEAEYLIAAATQALVDSLDSPSLRVLAGAYPSDRADLPDLAVLALEELGIPQPGVAGPTTEYTASGLILARLPRDRIRFEVAVAGGDIGGHEVLVFVNDVEMAALGAGMGMDPFDVLIPENRFVASPAPTRVPIARCECGTYGCGMTDVVIVRDGDAVHWDWEEEVPLTHGVTFPAEQYDAEVARLGADRSWERREDSIRRLILEQVDHARLDGYGVKLSWSAPQYGNPESYEVSVMIHEGDSRGPTFQGFLQFRWVGREPEDVAREVALTLRQKPQKWDVSFMPTFRDAPKRPRIAGRRWSRDRRGR